MTDMLGDAPPVGDEDLEPVEETGPHPPGLLERMLHPAVFAVTALLISASGLLSPSGGIAQRLTFALLARKEREELEAASFTDTVAQAQVSLMVLAALLAGVALWRRDDERSWWEPLAAAALLVAVLVAGVAVFAAVGPHDTDLPPYLVF